MSRPAPAMKMLSLQRARAAVDGRQRWVQPEALNVAPQWVGAALAAPQRRAWALGVDLLVVALLSGVGGLWLVLGLALVVLQLRSRRGASSINPAAAGTDPTAPSAAPVRRLAWVGWAAAALLLFLAASEAQQRWDDWRDPPSKRRDRAAQVAADDAAEAEAERAQALADAAAALKEAQKQVPGLAAVVQQVDAMAQAASAAPAAQSPEPAPEAASAAASVAGAAVAASSASTAAVAAPPNPDRLRIQQLEAELREARRNKPLSWHEQGQRLWDELASGLGWGIVYFSLLPAWWGGQTVGKKLFGLRVVELTGKPMTVMLCLKRYGGYAAGMATGGLGFAQVLWDVNRQALQDKAAHTVVIDLRAPAAPPRTSAVTDPPTPDTPTLGASTPDARLVAHTDPDRTA